MPVTKGQIKHIAVMIQQLLYQLHAQDIGVLLGNKTVFSVEDCPESSGIFRGIGSVIEIQYARSKGQLCVKFNSKLHASSKKVAFKFQLVSFDDYKLLFQVVGSASSDDGMLLYCQPDTADQIFQYNQTKTCLELVGKKVNP